MVFTTDVLIIGAGVIGCSLARDLSRYQVGKITVIDRGCDVSEGATKANSGIVHAGYDALTGTKKAFFNVRGADMFPALCEELHVPYRRCGALVVGFTPDDRVTLQKLFDRGKANGVRDLKIIEKDELLLLEPSLNPDVACALLVPSSGIVSPYELSFALADHAARNGAVFQFNQNVTDVSKKPDGTFHILTSGKDVFLCRVLVNCAGASSAMIHNCLKPESRLNMIHRRGQYYLLDHSVQTPFTRTIFQCPTVMGKGVLVSPTAHGNVLIGPSAEDIPDDLDTATTQAGLDFVLEKARLTWPQISVRMNITNFSGVRAHLDTDDFVIGPVDGVPGAFEAAGIESPGLSSAPAIAKALGSEIASFLNAELKEIYLPYDPPIRPFREMTPEEQMQAVAENPDYGSVICRCEVITEAEIRDAVRRPVGAKTLDGIKRRVRAGMGRCQGGFCSPRVAAILAEELNCSLLDITKDGGRSYLLSDTVDAFLKGEQRHE